MKERKREEKRVEEGEGEGEGVRRGGGHATHPLCVSCPRKKEYKNAKKTSGRPCRDKGKMAAYVHTYFYTLTSVRSRKVQVDIIPDRGHAQRNTSSLNPHLPMLPSQVPHLTPQLGVGPTLSAVPIIHFRTDKEGVVMATHGLRSTNPIITSPSLVDVPIVARGCLRRKCTRGSNRLVPVLWASVLHVGASA